MNSIVQKTAIALAAAVFMSTAAVNVQAKDDPAPRHRRDAVSQQDRGYRSLSPEKRAQVDAMVKESQEKLLPLQEKMMAKSLELQALSANPNADRGDVTKLSEEIAALHTQMFKEQTALSDRLSKELGLSGQRAPFMGGMGYDGCPGMMGRYGMGYHGSHMMGRPSHHMMGDYGMGAYAPGNWTQLPPQTAPAQQK